MFIIITLIVITIGLIIFIFFNPKLKGFASGKVLVFITFLILPVLIIIFSTAYQYTNSKSTQFCLSCHVMQPYGKSLLIDDQSYIPAHHYQNNLIPQKNACFTCHTTYTLFGDIKAKLRGLTHFFKYYFGEKYENIKLRTPYNNRECLHCHGESRSFQEGKTHNYIIDRLNTNEESCLTCHGPFHSVEILDKTKLWQKEEIK